MGSKSTRQGMSNLVPFTERSEDEVREMNRKGGKASGEARRKKKKLREAMEVGLSRELSEEQKQDLLAQNWSEEAIEELRYLAGITDKLIKKAMGGDITAYNAIRDILGEKPVDESKVSADVDTKIEIGFIETGIEPKSSEEDVDW